MSDVHVVILAAGKGTRMKSALPKVLHLVAGIPMIEHVFRVARSIAPQTVTVVVGHGADLVQTTLQRHAKIRYAMQQPQLGTGHALWQTEPLFRGVQGTLLLLSGDVPLLRAATMAGLLQTHRAHRAAMTVATATLTDPAAYGRIVRDHGRIVRIVEHRDASPEQRGIREVNSGVYAFDLAPLFPAIQKIAANNAQAEYYLPDLVGIYREQGLPVETFALEHDVEMSGINSRAEAAEVSRMVRQTKNEELMAAGVSIEDPSTTYIDQDVRIGVDTILHPGVHLEGQTVIGSACEIHSGVRIVDSTLDDEVTVHNFCVITNTRIASGARVGPFAHLRPDTEVGPHAHIGNFVELKKTALGAGSKANHLAYLGDATIGSGVNIGAGTITCNYDGEKKHRTIIEDGAFVGTDSQLIAPVRIGAGSYVAAGSSITEDVPPGALGIGRGRQVNVEGWVARKKQGKESEVRSQKSEGKTKKP
jgi:bifunctional UDP-N-acetylglucosamine pyrophosphorylase/glucosamine-1-phosphate N-acetyltransferase